MNPFTMFISGGILGILARVLDIFTQYRMYAEFCE